MRHRRLTILFSAVAVAAFVLLASGCGGGGGSPGVASVASPPTTAATATSTTQRRSGAAVKTLSPSGGAQGGQFQLSMNVGNATDGAKYSACMRKHGVTNFPDPNGQGVITIHSGMGIDPGSPAFTSARSVCQKLLPNGGQPTPAQIAQRQQQMLTFSVCMRAHAIKDFPDPSNGGIHLQGGTGSDLDPNNPNFQKAQQACQKDLPFKAQGTAKAGAGGG
jgi:hypothetical protein